MAEIPRYTAQRGLASFGGQPRLNVRAAGAGGEALAAAADRASGLLADFAAQKFEARRKAQTTEAVTRATRAVNDLRAGLDRDPEWRSAETRYADGIERIKTDILDGIDDDRVKAAFNARFSALAETSRVEVGKTAFRKEVDWGKSVMEDAVEVHAGEFGRAGNAAEAQLARANGFAAIRNAADAGYISREKAGELERDFLARGDEAQIRQILTDDPEAALEALGDEKKFTNLDPVRRARLTDTAARRVDTVLRERARAEDQAERDAEKRRKARGEELLKDAMDKRGAGALTGDDVEALRDFVTPAQYRSALKLLDPAEIEDDADAYAEVEALLHVDPQAASDLAFKHHAAGLLEDETLRSVSRKALALTAEDRPSSPYRRSRRFLSDALAPSPLFNDPLVRRRRAEALAVYDRYAESGTRSDADLRARADELIGQYGLTQAADSLDTLPRPRFADLPRGTTNPADFADALTRAEVETARRYRAGEINKAEAAEEARLLGRYRAALRRLPVAAGGGK